MIQQKNAKQQALYQTQEFKEILQNSKPMFQLTEKVVVNKPQKKKSSPANLQRNNWFNTQSINRKYTKDHDILMSINELTGEETASVKSSIKLDNSIIMNLYDKDSAIKPELDLKSTIMDIEKVESIELDSIRSPDTKIKPISNVGMANLYLL